MILPELVFATNNKHKAEEIGKLLLNQYKILNLKDIGCDVDIPETGNSFAENAQLKSSYVTDNFKLDCFADDSGLEIEVLGNEPGIYSARYSGVRDDAGNLNLVLKKMEGKTNRNAHFKTVISLNKNSRNYFFEGVIYGNITQTPIGDEGFGYDPIFMPIGYDRTFAQMTMAEKNEISHRAIAMKKLIAFLKEQA
nr:RdgB/HAM1 family non-canonical purine NTP pyrophosphatase [Pedobacter panaciterrae]